jgi:hypothetical protein
MFDVKRRQVLGLISAKRNIEAEMTKQDVV